MSEQADKKPTFEQALQELEEIVTQVEEGQIGLEDSIKKYEAGMKLIKYCRGVLDQAEKRVETISQEMQADSPAEPPATDGVA